MPAPIAPQPRRRRRLYVLAAVVVAGLAAVGWHLVAGWKNRLAGTGALGDVGQAVNGVGTELAAAADFSKRFVAQLSEGRWGDAYRATSDTFRQRVSEERFVAFARDHPALRESPLRIHFTLTRTSGGFIGRVTGNVTTAGGDEKGQFKADPHDASRARISLALVDQQGVTKVDQLTLDDRTLP